MQGAAHARRTKNKCLYGGIGNGFFGLYINKTGVIIIMLKKLLKVLYTHTTCGQKIRIKIKM